MAAQESGLTSCPAAGIPFNNEIAKVRKAKDDNVIFIYHSNSSIANILRLNEMRKI